MGDHTCEAKLPDINERMVIKQGILGDKDGVPAEYIELADPLACRARVSTCQHVSEDTGSMCVTHTKHTKHREHP